LAQLDAAKEIEKLDLPGNRLHALKGNLKGLWSITIGANLRVVFRFAEGKASDVDIVDYH
jgi:toxin HigB-1